MELSGNAVLEVVDLIQHTPFPQLLQNLLDETGGSKSDLFKYLLENNYYIEKTSMYRYFNTTRGTARMPERDFVCLFAGYVGLDETGRQSLLYLWQFKRRR